jgi:hypothetical protein
MFAHALTFAALSFTAPAAAATEIEPIPSAAWMCDVIIWIAETLGPNVPTTVDDIDTQAEPVRVGDRVELLSLDGIDARAGYRALTSDEDIPTWRVDAVRSSSATLSLGVADACAAGFTETCAAPEGARLFVDLDAAGTASVSYGMAFEKIVLTYDDGE